MTARMAIVTPAIAPPDNPAFDLGLGLDIASAVGVTNIVDTTVAPSFVMVDRDVMGERVREGEAVVMAVVVVAEGSVDSVEGAGEKLE